MSALHIGMCKKRKGIPLCDGSHGISHGRQPGLSSVRFTKPSIHPLDWNASLEVAAPGRQTKRPRLETIRRAQFPAFEEQAR